MGFVSLCMDASSELVHGLLPVFMVGTLGAGMASVGLIEGLAEATASITKLFSGILSDVLGRRKLLAVIGYGLATLSKPLFPLASSLGLVFAARFVDRIGKGIRGAPRDALIADIAPVHLRGACYGLRQSLDTVGAVLGPLLAVLLVAGLAFDIRTALWFAVLPAMLAVLLLVVGVEEPRHAPAAERPAAGAAPLHVRDLRLLPGAYWRVLLTGGLLTLARFSEAFLVLRAGDVGLGTGLVPLVMVVMSLAYALSSYPAGVLADRIDRRRLLALGIAALLLADLVLAAAGAIVPVMLGVALWGLHMGLTQGLLATLVADTAPPALRGSAFGLFNLLTGLVLLAASLVAGILWDRAGAAATFLAGGGFALLSLLTLSALGRRRAIERPLASRSRSG